MHYTRRIQLWLLYTLFSQVFGTPVEEGDIQ